MLQKFIKKHSNDIITKEDMVQAVTEYKEQIRSIDDRDYMALRNYIWKIQYGSHIMAKIPPEERPPPLKSTPDGVCEEIGEYFFKKETNSETNSETYSGRVGSRFFVFSNKINNEKDKNLPINK